MRKDKHTEAAIDDPVVSFQNEFHLLTWSHNKALSYKSKNRAK